MVISRLEMILTKAELNRICVEEEQGGTTTITVDVHGMKCTEARRFINNIINLVRGAFQLVIIHGYTHGTAIKEMLATNFVNSHIYKRFPDSKNKGVTHMLIAA